MTALPDMTPDELREEMQVAAAHGKIKRFWRCMKLWLDKMDWTTADLARHIAKEFRAGLH